MRFCFGLFVSESKMQCLCSINIQWRFLDSAVMLSLEKLYQFDLSIFVNIVNSYNNFSLLRYTIFVLPIQYSTKIRDTLRKEQQNESNEEKRNPLAICTVRSNSINTIVKCCHESPSLQSRYKKKKKKMKVKRKLFISSYRSKNNVYMWRRIQRHKASAASGLRIKPVACSHLYAGSVPLAINLLHSFCLFVIQQHKEQNCSSLRGTHKHAMSGQ